MNILSSTSTPTLQQTPSRAASQIAAVRPLDNLGERQAARSGPQGAPKGRDDAIAKLQRHALPEVDLPLRGRRAIAAYTSLSRSDEQSYVHQVLGFEVRI